MINFKNISFTVKTGDFVIIIGHNGSGKSSLFNTLLGKIIPTSGEIHIFKKNVTYENELSKSCYVTTILQDTKQNCIESLSIIENFSLYYNQSTFFKGTINKKLIDEVPLLVRQA